MKHFTRQEWSAFAKGQMEETKNSEMEDHLLECNSCLEVYLSFISGEDEARSKDGLSFLFTENVMKSINDLEAKRRKKSNKKRDIFYYSAAACLTLFFTAAGIFQGFAEIIPEVARTETRMERIFEIQEQRIIRFGWSDKLMDNTLTFIDSIKPKGEEEVVY